MNKNHHRLMWSKSRGLLTAVANGASSGSGKSASGRAGPRSSRSCTKALTHSFQASNVPVTQVLSSPIAIISVASTVRSFSVDNQNQRFCEQNTSSQTGINSSSLGSLGVSYSAEGGGVVGSDCMLNILGMYLNAMQERSGDGFAE